MTSRTRTILMSVLAVVVVAGAALGGWLIIERRAEGSGRMAIPAAVLTDLPAPPSPEKTASPRPPESRWTVAVLLRRVSVYDKPSRTARIRLRLPAKTRFGSETVCLIRKSERSGGAIWHNVWLPTGPNGARGWIMDRSLRTYPVKTQIVIDLSARKLTVAREDDSPLERFPVAVGEPSFPTPTGEFFITEKIRPTDTSGPYGVFVMALSAYSPQLAEQPEWQGGQVAIHGTNQPQLIGQAISHGCIRMRNADILRVNTLVKTGSPVTIKK